jgi:hypothetical protein
MEENHPIKNRYSSQQTPHSRYTQTQPSGSPRNPSFSEGREWKYQFQFDASLGKKLAGTHFNK